MKTISIEVPDEVKVPEKDLERLVKVELALRLYQKGTYHWDRRGEFPIYQNGGS